MKNTDTNIYPRPQSFKPSGGKLSVTQGRLWLGTGLNRSEKRLLSQLFPGLETANVESGLAHCFGLTVDGHEPDIDAAGSFDGEEYEIKVTKKGIVARAKDAGGLACALQSLRQWLAAGDLPCGVLRDKPGLKLRAMHLDLKGGMPRFEVLLETLENLAELKYNAILVEYEDKFPFESCPDLVSPQALDRSQLEHFLARAQELRLEVIPLLQCFGHVEYILRNPRYADLGEEVDALEPLHHQSSNQFCPLNIEASALFESMAKEIIEAHPDSRRFHIGGDETRDLGRCPDCAVYIEDHGREALFLTAIRRACALLEDHDKQALVWDDMFREMETVSDKDLPGNLVFLYWLYYTDPRDLEKEAYPFLDNIKKLKRPVIGAGSTRGADDAGPELPIFETRANNVLSWARTAAVNGLEGMIATSWARYTSMNLPCETFDSSWPAMGLCADYAWNTPAGKDKAMESMNAVHQRSLERFFAVFHGIAGEQARHLALAVLGMRKRGHDREKMLVFRGKASRHGELLDWLVRLEESHITITWCKALVEELDWRFHRLGSGHTGAGEKDHYVARLRDGQAKLKKLEPRLRETLLQRLNGIDVDEYMASRFDLLRYRLSGHLVTLATDQGARIRESVKA